MNTSWTRRILPSLLIVSLVFVTDSVHGQTFLEKLENAVRAQAENSTAPAESSSTGELPAPASRSTPAQPKVTSPRTPPPQPVPPSSSPALKPTPRSGRVYLGLEAVNNPGAGIGVQVAAVANRSPAWKAGFQVNDRIVAINGFAIGSLDDMVTQIGKTAPGQTVRFLISRDDRSISLTAVMMDADLAGQIASNPIPIDGDPFLGLTVNDLTNPFRRQFGISVFRGAAVSDVASGSPAYQAGIRPGDAVVEADGLPIESANALIRWVKSTRPGQEVNLLVYRGGIGREVQLIIGAEGQPALTSPTRSSATFRGNAAARPSIPPVAENADIQIPGISRNTPSPVNPSPVNPSGVNQAQVDAKRVNPGQRMVPSDNTADLRVPPPNAGELSSILELQEPRPQPGDFEPQEFEAADLALNPSSQTVPPQKLQAELNQLRVRNEALTQELNATKEQLRRTEAKLEQILQLLKNQ